MKKLIHVVRGTPDRGTAIVIVSPDGAEVRLRRHPEVILTKRQEVHDNSNFAREAEFFLVEVGDADTVQTVLAQNNPGCEVRVYACEQIAQCPAGEIVRKKVSESGVLPG